MGSLNLYLEDRINDHILGGPDYVRVGTVYLGLFTSIGADGEGGVELASPGDVAYMRAAVTNNATNFPASVSGSKTLAIAHSFPEAGSNWGTIVGVIIFDDQFAGNRLMWTTFSGVPVMSGQTASFGINGLTITVD